MPFITLMPGRGRRNEGDDIVVSADAAGVRVILAATLVQELQWKAGQQVALDLGSGEDDGMARVRGATVGETGWKLSAAGGDREDLRLRVRRWSGIPEKVQAIGSAVERLDSGFSFRLPWVPASAASHVGMQINVAVFGGEEDLPEAGGDKEYRAAKRLLREKHFDVRPADSGTDSHIDGKRMNRDEVCQMANALLHTIGQVDG